MYTHCRVAYDINEGFVVPCRGNLESVLRVLLDLNGQGFNGCAAWSQFLGAQHQRSDAAGSVP